MMGFRFYLLIALAVSCHGLPTTTEEVVPERQTMLLQHTAAFTKMTPTAFISAMTSSGGSEADCRTFADTTIKDIEKTVKASQSEVDLVSKGTHCAAEGQEEVKTEKAKVEAAKLVVQNAEAVAASKKKAKDTAAAATFVVNFDLMSVPDTGSGSASCVDISRQASYVAVKNARDTAITESTAADQAVVIAKTKAADAETALKGVVDEASRLMSGCLCIVHKAQELAWAAVSTATAAHAADWKSAHEVICALDKTATCNVPTCPTVTQPTVAAGVANADSEHCTAAPTTAPTRPPPVCTIIMAGHQRRCTGTCDTGRVDGPYDNCGGAVQVSGDCSSVWVYDNDDHCCDGANQDSNYGARHTGGGWASIGLTSDHSNDCAGYRITAGY